MSKAPETPHLKESPLFWPAYMKRDALHILDETLIPKKMTYIKVKTAKQAVGVIRSMKTRAFGQFLVVLNSFLLELNRFKTASDKVLIRKLEQVANDLNKSRPTFPFKDVTSIILVWANQAVKEGQDVPAFVSRNIHGYLEGIRHRRLARVAEIANLIQDGDSILTHCNVSGELAMAAWMCREEGKEVHFFATETRPFLQGMKLTTWELKRLGAKVTLIADNAVGSILSDGLVNKVIVGSDRSCANGDVANKIGTYQIAVLAKEFNIPVFVLTQPSNTIKKGADIPIEIRDSKELLFFNKKKIVSGGVKAFYPGFDIVPHDLITKAISINVR